MIIVRTQVQSVDPTDLHINITACAILYALKSCDIDHRQGSFLCSRRSQWSLARQSRGTFMVVMGTEYLAVTIVSVGYGMNSRL